MLRDLRYAFHLMVKDRWYSAVAIVALALGIGVNATVFTLVNAILIRGLPYQDSARLYMLGSQDKDGNRFGVSALDLQDWRAQAKTFVGLAAFSNNGVNVSDDRSAPQNARSARALGQRLPAPRPASRHRPELHAGRRADRRRKRGHHRPRDVEEPLCRGSRHPRQVPSARRQAGHDHRRHAGRGAVSVEHGDLDAHRPDGRPAEAGRQVPAGLRPAAARREPAAGADRAERHRRAPRDRVSRHEQGDHRRPRGDLQRAIQRRQHPDGHAGDDGGGRVRPAHRLRQRRQPAAVAVGASLARGGRPHRARRHALARGPPAAGRKRAARHDGRRDRPRPRPRRRPALRQRRRGFRQAVLDQVHDGLHRLRLPRGDLRRDGHPVRARARAAGDEDQRQRGAQGRRPRQRRRPARAVADGDDGRPRARADARAARRRGPDGAELPEALHDRHRDPDREPGVDGAAAAEQQVSGAAAGHGVSRARVKE